MNSLNNSCSSKSKNVDSTIVLILLFCTLNPIMAASANTNLSEAKHGEMKHEEMNHGKMNHGKMKHGEMEHGEMKHASTDSSHHHKPVEVSEWPATPSLTLTAHKDLMSGWNLHIVPKHFNFAPKNVNTPTRTGEGHAHLYINGEKITRIYSNWFYLNNLPSGTHKVTVSLNANDHGHLVMNGIAVTSTIELVQE